MLPLLLDHRVALLSCFWRAGQRCITHKRGSLTFLDRATQETWRSKAVSWAHCCGWRCMAGTQGNLETFTCPVCKFSPKKHASITMATALVLGAAASLAGGAVNITLLPLTTGAAALDGTPYGFFFVREYRSEPHKCTSAQAVQCVCAPSMHCIHTRTCLHGACVLSLPWYREPQQLVRAVGKIGQDAR
jgi:hypothetical protein